jgi:hypothetical protein
MSLSTDVVGDLRSDAAQGSVTQARHWQALWRQFLTASLLFALVAAATLGWTLFRVHSFALVVPYLRGERLLVDTSALSLGEQKTKSVVERHIHVLNLSDSDVTLLGANRTCSCLSVDSFPITISRGEGRNVTIKSRMRNEPSEYEESVRFFTDFPDRREFGVTVRASVH